MRTGTREYVDYLRDILYAVEKANTTKKGETRTYTDWHVHRLARQLEGTVSATSSWDLPRR
jgi:hypothetical protein